MRSSIMLVPAMLHRFGVARIEDDVTGCTLGVREVDPHIEVFLAFGAEVSMEPGAVTIRAPRRFVATDHWLDYASVTTSENFVLCAATAHGRSRLTNAACEPHVQEFCTFLGLMGARIAGTGGSQLQVDGLDALGGAEYTFADDFHEVATFLALSAITGGDVAVRNGASAQFPLLDRTFAKFGVELEHRDGFSRAHVGGPLQVRPPITATDAESGSGALALRAGRPAADLRRPGRARRRLGAVLEQGLRGRARLEPELASSVPTRPCATRTGWSFTAASRWCRPPWRAPTSSASRSRSSCSPRASRAARRS